MYRFLDITAAAHPQRIAVLHGDGRTTYAELAEAAKRFAYALESASVRQGDRAVVSFTNVMEFIPAYFGILKAGCIPVLLHSETPAGQVAAIIKDVNAAGLIGHTRFFADLPEVAPSLRFAFLDGPCPESLSGIPHFRPVGEILAAAAPRQRKFDSMMLDHAADTDGKTIIFTSGTTGMPKGVILPDESLRFATDMMIDFLKLTHEDRSLIGMPFTHLAGLLHMISQIRSGGSVVTGITPALPGSFCMAASEREVTGLPIVPSTIRMLWRQYPEAVARYFSKLRYIELSSEPYDAGLIEELLEALPEVAFYNTYGLTEAPRATYYNMRSSSGGRLSVGRPNTGVTVRIVDSSGMPCKQREVGEIYILGKNLAEGYWNRPELTNRVFTPGGFKTGDMASADEEGRITLAGRADTMVKIRGESVFSEEIEAVLSAFPGVMTAEVTSKDEPVTGRALFARVVTKNNSVTRKDLLKYCRKHLAKFKIPKYIEFVPESGPSIGEHEVPAMESETEPRA